MSPPFLLLPFDSRSISAFEEFGLELKTIFHLHFGTQKDVFSRCFYLHASVHNPQNLFDYGLKCVEGGRDSPFPPLLALTLSFSSEDGKRLTYRLRQE